MKTVNFLSGVLLAMALCGPVCAAPADYHVVPMPQRVQMTKGAAFQLSDDVQILAAPELQREAEFLQQYLREVTGMQLNITDKQKGQRTISLTISPKVKEAEGYVITVNQKGIRIEGALQPVCSMVSRPCVRLQHRAPNLPLLPFRMLPASHGEGCSSTVRVISSRRIV